MLQEAGLEALYRNWRCSEGELDIVARDSDGTCVFVEVRSRTGTDKGHPLETIDARKRGQIIRTARAFIHKEQPNGITGYRFDVVGIVFAPDGRVEEAEHLPDAFTTNDVQPF